MKMARFLGKVQGQRGAATRLGSPKSGLLVTANGWNSGVKVYAKVNQDGHDIFEIYGTAGSNGHKSDYFIAKIVDGELTGDSR